MGPLSISIQSGWPSTGHPREAPTISAVSTARRSVLQMILSNLSPCSDHRAAKSFACCLPTSVSGESYRPSIFSSSSASDLPCLKNQISITDSPSSVQLDDSTRTGLRLRRPLEMLSPLRQRTLPAISLSHLFSSRGGRPGRRGGLHCTDSQVEARGLSRGASTYPCPSLRP